MRWDGSVEGAPVGKMALGWGETKVCDGRYYGAQGRRIL